MDLEKYRNQLGMDLGRSCLKHGGRPMKNMPREEHYLGEKTINKAKGVIKGVKEGYNTAKDVVKTGKEIYKTIKDVAPKAKKIYNEDINPILHKASDEALAVRKKILNRRSGGEVKIAHSYPHGTDPRDVPMYDNNAVNVTNEYDYKKPREKHLVGTLAGLAMRAAPMIAKAVAPAVIGWGANKVLKKVSPNEKYGGGKIMEKRTAATPREDLVRKNRAPGGTAKVRRGQYD